MIRFLLLLSILLFTNLEANVDYDIELSRKLIDRGDYDKAYDIMREYAKQNPKSVMGLGVICDLYIRKNLDKKAVTECTKGIKESKTPNDTLYTLRAQAYLSLHNPKKAIEDAKKVIEIDNSNKSSFPAYTTLAESYIELNKLKEADKILNFLEEEYYSHYRAFRARGNYYNKTRKVSLAKEYYRKSISMAPNQPDSYIALARLYMSVKEYQKAKSVLLDGKSVKLTSVLESELAHIEYLLGNSDLALKMLNAIIKKSQDIYAYKYRAQINLKRKKYALAIQDYETMISLGIENQETYILLAYAYYLESMSQKSLDMLKKALSYSTTNGKIFYIQAMARHDLGDKFGAIQSIEKALSLDKTNHVSYMITYLNIFYDFGRYYFVVNKSLKLLTHKDIVPLERMEILSILALAYDSIDKRKQALKAIDESYKLFKTLKHSTESKANLSEAYIPLIYAYIYNKYSTK